MEQTDYEKIQDCMNIIFKSDQGKVVLGYLANQCAVGHLDGNHFMDMNAQLNPDQFMFLREGQDSVFRHILRMIKQAEERNARIDG